MPLLQHQSLWLVARLYVSNGIHNFHVSDHMCQSIRALYQSDPDCLHLAAEVIQSESSHLAFRKLFMHHYKLYSGLRMRLTWITKYYEKGLAVFVYLQH